MFLQSKYAQYFLDTFDQIKMDYVCFGCVASHFCVNRNPKSMFRSCNVASRSEARCARLPQLVYFSLTQLQHCHSTCLWHTSSSSEQLRKGPHDEPGIDVILQELYVCSSADHGVQVPTLGGLVEYDITTHEHPCFRCWGPDLVQAVVQHFSEHLPTFWVIRWWGVAEVDSCWMIWDITILPSRMMTVSSKLMSNFKPGKIKNVGHMQYLRRWYQNDVLEVLQCLQLPQLKNKRGLLAASLTISSTLALKS